MNFKNFLKNKIQKVVFNLLVSLSFYKLLYYSINNLSRPLSTPVTGICTAL